MANTVLIFQACLQVTGFKKRDGSDKCGLITEITDKVKESAKAIAETNLRSFQALGFPRWQQAAQWPAAHALSVATFPGSFGISPSSPPAQVLVCEGEVCPLHSHQGSQTGSRALPCMTPQTAALRNTRSAWQSYLATPHHSRQCPSETPQGCSVPRQAVQVN